MFIDNSVSVDRQSYYVISSSIVMHTVQFFISNLTITVDVTREESIFNEQSLSCALLSSQRCQINI